MTEPSYSKGKMLSGHSVPCIPLLLLLISSVPVLVDYSMQIRLTSGYMFASLSTEVAIHRADDRSAVARSFNKCGFSPDTVLFCEKDKVLPPLKEAPQVGLLRCCKAELDSIYIESKQYKGLF